jgi:hypothetical protein
MPIKFLKNRLVHENTNCHCHFVLSVNAGYKSLVLLVTIHSVEGKRYESAWPRQLRHFSIGDRVEFYILLIKLD